MTEVNANYSVSVPSPQLPPQEKAQEDVTVFEVFSKAIKKPFSAVSSARAPSYQLIVVAKEVKSCVVKILGFFSLIGRLLLGIEPKLTEDESAVDDADLRFDNGDF